MAIYQQLSKLYFQKVEISINGKVASPNCLDSSQKIVDFLYLPCRKINQESGLVILRKIFFKRDFSDLRKNISTTFLSFENHFQSFFCFILFSKMFSYFLSLFPLFLSCFRIVLSQLVHPNILREKID